MSRVSQNFKKCEFHRLNRRFNGYDDRPPLYSDYRGGARGGGGGGGGEYGGRSEDGFSWRDADEIARQERRFQMRGLRGKIRDTVTGKIFFFVFVYSYL